MVENNEQDVKENEGEPNTVTGFEKKATPSPSPFWQDEQMPSQPSPFATKEDEKVMTVGNWMVVNLLMLIPLVNIILLFVWSFGDGTNKNKKSYARASLIWMAIVFVIYMVIIFMMISIFSADFQSGFNAGFNS